MRWFWIDRFVEFESGRRAAAVKAVTLAEEQLDNYIPGFPVMPASLIIEGFAQTGGLLVGECRPFVNAPCWPRSSKSKFHRETLPGDLLRYEVTIDDLRDDGAIVHGVAKVDDQLQAEVELVFAHLDDRFRGVDLFYPADLLAILRLLGVYDVGRKPDGTRWMFPRTCWKLKSERMALDGPKLRRADREPEASRPTAAGEMVQPGRGTGCSCFAGPAANRQGGLCAPALGTAYAPWPIRSHTNRYIAHRP